LIEIEDGIIKVVEKPTLEKPELDYESTQLSMFEE